MKCVSFVKFVKHCFMSILFLRYIDKCINVMLWHLFVLNCRKSNTCICFMSWRTVVIMNCKLLQNYGTYIWIHISKESQGQFSVPPTYQKGAGWIYQRKRGPMPKMICFFTIKCQGACVDKTPFFTISKHLWKLYEPSVDYIYKSY